MLDTSDFAKKTQQNENVALFAGLQFGTKKILVGIRGSVSTQFPDKEVYFPENINMMLSSVSEKLAKIYL